jgi:hypothetical protein
LLVIARLLPKVVGWKTQDQQALVLVFAVQAFQGIKLRGKTAFACRINYQNNLILVIAQIDFFTLQGGQLMVVKLITSGIGHACGSK